MPHDAPLSLVFLGHSLQFFTESPSFVWHCASVNCLCIYVCFNRVVYFVSLDFGNANTLRVFWTDLLLFTLLYDWLRWLCIICFLSLWQTALRRRICALRMHLNNLMRVCVFSRVLKCQPALLLRLLLQPTKIAGQPLPESLWHQLSIHNLMSS